MSTPTLPELPELKVVDTFPVEHVGAKTLLRLAAAADPDSTDPVDKALARAASKQGPPPEVLEFEAASVDKPYSTARVRLEGRTYRVIRGDLMAVCEASSSRAVTRMEAMRRTSDNEKLGRRCLGVAVGEDEGDIAFSGTVALTLVRAITPQKPELVAVKVWPVALRIQHWLNLALIVVLSFTGYFIMDPSILPTPTGETSFLFGWIRFVHFVAGFLWMAVGIWRIGLALFTRYRHAQWRSFWPLKSKEDLRNMGGTIQFYLFLKRHGPHYVGHNVLQQLAYTGLYSLAFLQVLTGLSLFGLANQYSWFWSLMALPVHWLGVPTIRVIHTLIMFGIWAFVILHVYLVMRADALENNGETSSMFNGRVFLPQGAKPVDHHRIE